jgi:hypothetical protein
MYRVQRSPKDDIREQFAEVVKMVLEDYAGIHIRILYSDGEERFIVTLGPEYRTEQAVETMKQYIPSVAKRMDVDAFLGKKGRRGAGKIWMSRKEFSSFWSWVKYYDTTVLRKGKKKVGEKIKLVV